MAQNYCCSLQYLASICICTSSSSAISKINDFPVLKLPFSDLFIADLVWQQNRNSFYHAVIHTHQKKFKLRSGKKNGNNNDDNSESMKTKMKKCHRSIFGQRGLVLFVFWSYSSRCMIPFTTNSSLKPVNNYFINRVAEQQK